MLQKKGRFHVVPVFFVDLVVMDNLISSYSCKGQDLIYFEPSFISDYSDLFTATKNILLEYLEYGLQIDWAICLTADQLKQQVT